MKNPNPYKGQIWEHNDRGATRYLRVLRTTRTGYAFVKNLDTDRESRVLIKRLIADGHYRYFTNAAVFSTAAA